MKQMPASVKLIFIFLIIIFVYRTFESVLLINSATEDYVKYAVAFGTLLNMGLMYFLWARKIWAKIIYSVFMCLGVLTGIFLFFSPEKITISILIESLFCLVMLILFFLKPTQDWFRNK